MPTNMTDAEKKPTPRRKSAARSPVPVSRNMALLRALRIALKSPPDCCGKPMREIMLYFGRFTDDKMTDDLAKEFDGLTEEQLADDTVENTIIAPCWSCDVCEKEIPITGLESWPKYEPKKEPQQAFNAAKVWKHCPHCGEKLTHD